MGRSGHLSGATVALDLLPKVIACAEDGPPQAQLLGADAETIKGSDTVQARLCALSIASEGRSIPLAPVVAFADLTHPLAQPEAEPALTNLPEGLGHLLFRLLQTGRVDTSLLYSCALCFAMLNRRDEAQALLAMMTAPADSHPAILALKGYLALQTGEAEQGRRALARAALASRGSPANRGILHFTQHVLLVHQFNG